MMNRFKNHISIIAFHGHFDILSDFLQLLIHQNIFVNLFTTNVILEFIDIPMDNEAIRIFTAKNHQELKLIENHWSILQSSDEILNITIAGNFKFYSQLSAKIPMTMVIHNAHFMFADHSYRINHFRFRDLPGDNPITIEQHKNRLLHHCRKLYFLSSNSLGYAQMRYSGLASKMHLIPYQYTHGFKLSDENFFQITIPGGINLANRDYSFLYQWISEINYSRPIRICFLGKSSKKSINLFIRRLNTTCAHKIDIQYFNTYLSQEQYLHLLQTSDILLAPVKSRVKFKNYSEIYGLSKNSGSINDALRFMIPLILPQHYSFDPLMNSLIDQYHDQLSFNLVMNKYYHNIQPDIKPYNTHDIKLVRKSLLKTMGLT